eukprot:jgi/Picre1/33335/NNA_008659.t1
MKLSVPAGYMERFLVRNGSDSEDEETPPSGQYHLTPRQCITVYMCGVRPKDLKRVHSSQEEGSSYVRTYLQHKEKFANDHNGTDKICPGHALDIIDYLSEKFDFTYNEITTDSQVQQFYKTLKDKFGLKPDYLQACKLYAYGIPIDFIFQIPTNKKIAECVEETASRFERDNPRRDTSTINPASKYQSVQVTFADDTANKEGKGHVEEIMTPHKPRKSKRTAF